MDVVLCTLKKQTSNAKSSSHINVFDRRYERHSNPQRSQIITTASTSAETGHLGLVFSYPPTSTNRLGDMASTMTSSFSCSIWPTDWRGTWEDVCWVRSDSWTAADPTPWTSHPVVIGVAAPERLNYVEESGSILLTSDPRSISQAPSRPIGNIEAG